MKAYEQQMRDLEESEGTEVRLYRTLKAEYKAVSDYSPLRWSCVRAFLLLFCEDVVYAQNYILTDCFVFMANR